MSKGVDVACFTVFQHLYGETEKNSKTSYLRQAVFRWRFDPGTFRKPVRSISPCPSSFRVRCSARDTLSESQTKCFTILCVTSIKFDPETERTQGNSKLTCT